MSAEPDRPNWVERRYHREQALTAQAADVWDAVRKRLQDACDSFKFRFLKDGGLEANPENRHRISIVRTFPATANSKSQQHQVIVNYSSEKFTINVVRDSGSQLFHIEANENQAYITNGQTILDPDEVSRMILEPLLFARPVVNLFANMPKPAAPKL